MFRSMQRRGLGSLCLAIAVLAIAVGAGAALADEMAGESNPLPSTTDVVNAIGAGNEQVDGSLTDPGAATGVPLEDLDRGQAQALLSGVFGSIVEAPSGIYDELQAAAILTPNVATLPVVSSNAETEAENEEAGEKESEAPRSAEEAPPSSAPELTGASLIHSTVPLQVEDDDGSLVPVDLTLGRSEGDLQPVAPLVDVQIPNELADGVELPDLGITVKLAGVAEGRSPSVTDDNAAFYPNVAEDVDFAVAPAPRGFETFSQLRNSDSPTTQVYKLSLPGGAILAETDSGGAEVVKDGETLLAVQPPVAIDAAGSDVPVALEVDGDLLRVSADPPPGAAHPILVDPLWQSYEWMSRNTTAGICSSSTEYEPGGPCENREEWGYDVLEYPWGGSRHLWIDNGATWVKRGIYVGAQGQQRAGDHAAVIYTVPRYFKETPPPTSFIKTLKVSNVNWEALGSSASPYLFMGIWDYVNQGWIQYFSHTGEVEHGINDPAWIYEFKNAQPNKNGKVAQVGIWATEASAGSNARVYAGGASVELGDVDVPQSPMTSSQPQWVNESPSPLSFTASDTGLGVFAMNVSTEPNNPAGAFTWKQKHGCVGIGNAACPRTWKSTDAGTPAVTYNPSVLPNGLNYLALVAEDPVGNKSASSWAEVRVDHSTPQLTTSGNLTEQGVAGTNLREYTLNYTAKDGDDVPAAALAPWGSAGKGEGQLERPIGVAMAPDGSIYTVDRLNNRVVKYDKEGKFALQFGSTGSADGQFNDPRGIDIAPDGTVWVADLGNDSIKAFSPSGTFLRKARFTDSASEPYAVASGPGGVLWVTDTGLRRVIKLSEDPLSTLLVTTGKDSPNVGTAVISPTGIATDKFGNVWIADGGLGKILELDSAGKFKFQFGTTGSGDGQINGVTGIDVSPAGNIAITERSNGRVQIFKPDGSYLRKFGSAGSASSQFFEASGLSFGPDNTLAVADAGNKRIVRWTHADQDPQSGAAKLEVKVDGVAVHTKEPGCTTKNCQISGSWTLDADDFAGGAHKVEVTATDAVGITQTKTIDIETHGDHTDPAIALSGTMTQQASIGTTRPSYKLKAVATDPGPTEELKSGVASTVIKVDGTVVDSSSPGCPAGGCSITREWTLNSESYSVGSHTVEVKATDAAGRVSTKTLTIDIARDTTAPEVSYPGALYSAPSGWLEQKKVGYAAFASDAGYGVTSVELKIDGVAVNSVTQTCAAGGCSKFFGGSETVDMAQYSGGAHPAEFIARDGAGNVRKRTWTINVDPEGHISASEAEDTLEALEATSDANPIGPSQEEDIYGTASDLGLSQESEGFIATGSAVPSVVSNTPSEGMSFKILPDSALAGPCLSLEPEDPEADAETNQSTPEPEETEHPTPSCESAGEAEYEENFHLEGIEVTPVAAALGTNVNIGGSAALAASTSGSVDTITRPLYEGALTFKAIRAPDALQAYSWRIELGEGQTLKLLDAQHVTVYYASGHAAFSIAAEPAHDAVGTSVPTHLSVDGDDTLTLHVNHTAASYTYPILAGTGWRGGFISEEVPGPMDEQELREERERIEQEEREALEAEEAGDVTYIQATDRWDAVSIMFQGPPIANLAQSGPDKGIEQYTFGKKFKFRTCYYDGPDAALPELKRSESIEEAVRQCKGRIGWRRLEAKLVVHGWYRTNTNMRAVWILKGNLHCDKWGHDVPAMVNCGKDPGYWQPEGAHILVYGDYRFWPGDGPAYLQPPSGAGTSACVTIRGRIEYGKGTDPQEPILSPARQGTPCDWPYDF